MESVEALALVSGRVDEELLLRNEYLAAENEILKSKLNKPLRLNNYERIRLAKIDKRIGLKALREISCIVRPETILEWFRRLVAKKFDGSKFRKKAGRPRIDYRLESLIKQIARNVTMADWGFLEGCIYLIHDRDTKFCKSFQAIIASMGIMPIRLPPQSPKMNSFAERFVRSIKEECLKKLIFFGEDSLRKALVEYTNHYHDERNHQGKGNLLLFPDPKLISNKGKIKRHDRLHGLLKYYFRTAA